MKVRRASPHPPTPNPFNLGVPPLRWQIIAAKGKAKTASVPRIIKSCFAKTRIIIWIAPCAGKMNQIVRCDWLPERARWSYFARSGLPAVSREKNFLESHIINPGFIDQVCSVKVAGYWHRSFLHVYESRLRLGLNTPKIELGQYPVILTSHLVNNPYLLYG